LEHEEFVDVAKIADCFHVAPTLSTSEYPVISNVDLSQENNERRTGLHHLSFGRLGESPSVLMTAAWPAEDPTTATTGIAPVLSFSWMSGTPETK
jgi:hypothetical protein